jgi:hypothetical protein
MTVECSAEQMAARKEHYWVEKTAVWKGFHSVEQKVAL